MNVLLDGHMLGTRETGNETYVYNLAQQFEVFKQQGIHLCVLTARARPDLQAQITDPTCQSDLRRFFSAIPRAYAASDAQLLHVTYHAPFWMPQPYIITIHDISYRTKPLYHSLRNVAIQNILVFLSILRAQAIITVSNYCKNEIERIYPGANGRTFVTLEAADKTFHPAPGQKIELTKKKLGIQKPYILATGKFQPRKNFERLVQCFDKLLATSTGYQLVIVGDHNTDTGIRLKARYRRLIENGDLLLPGYLDTFDIVCLYSGCAVFMYPSLYEGFGLPVLEAMQCGAPVITSNCTAIPEVAGNAAVLIDPFNIDAIYGAMHHILNNANFRQNIIERGVKHSREFSWESTAQQTAAIYRQVLIQKSRD